MARVKLEVDPKDLGVVYCLSNPSFSYLKIGKTDALTAEGRAKDLYDSGVPRPFKVLFAKRVLNSQKAEKSAHDHFKQYRINPKREFFDITVQQALEYFTRMDGIWDPSPSIDLVSSVPVTNDIIVPTETAIQQMPAQQTPKPISIYAIRINHITEDERDYIITLGMSCKCLEARMIGEYFYFDSIQKGVKLTSDIRFNAILNSPTLGYFIITSDNFKEAFADLRENAPYSFVELDQRLDD